AEAITHFSHALSLASTGKRPITEIADLHIRRGNVLSVSGQFERARQDYEKAAELSHTSDDPMLEWRALISLGGLWGGLDYSRSGDYFEQALTVAQEINEPLAIARSL